MCSLFFPRRVRPTLLALLLLSLPLVTSAQVLVVPGAPNSPGMDTRAAYGNGTSPSIYRVTKLADDGSAGTLRVGMEGTGNRVIIFEISGEIILQGRDIVVTSPYMTVAGQTAPDPGITIRHYGIQINAHDILLQHFRIRHGLEPGDITCGNNLEIWGNNAYNIVVDHLSTSWGEDEGIITLNTARPSNTVIWRTIMSEGLFNPPGAEGCGGGGSSGGHGLLVYVETKGVTVAQSVFAKNHERNPNSQGGTSLVFLNNLIYGWVGAEGILFVNFDGGGGFGNIWKASVVGNRFVANARTTLNDDLTAGSAYMFWYSANGGTPLGNEIYRSDNTLANPNGSIGDTNNFLSYDPNIGSPPTLAPLPVSYSVIASTAVEANARTNAGARPNDRDAVDTRLFNEIAARASAVPLISFPTDVGGWPTLAVNTRALTVPTRPNADDDGNGYTDLEEWLHGYAATVEGSGPAAVPAAAGSLLVTAHFTGTAGTPLTGYTSDTGGGWAFQTGSTGVLALDNANRVVNLSLNQSAVQLAAAIPITAQYDVDADLRIVSATAFSEYAIWGRAQSTTVTGYFFSADVAGSTGSLQRVINGTYATMGSCAHTFVVGTTAHLTLRLRNSGQYALIDGVQCTSTADNSITLAGQAGISAYSPATADTNTTGAHFDEFVVRDVATASGPVITTAALPNGALTAAYSALLTVTGGTAPYTFAITAGAIPTGTTLNTNTGAITGTPTFATTYTPTIRVTDAVAATSTKNYGIGLIIRVAAAITTTSPLGAGERLSPYTTTLAATGDEAPYTWAISSGTLPAGLSLSASTGIISGTPTVSATTSFTVRLTGALGSTVTKALSITVSDEYRPANRPVSRNQAEGVVFRRTTAPTNPSSSVMKGDLWVNTSTAPPTVYVCTGASATTATWVALP